MNKSSCCSTSSPAFGVVGVLDCGYSSRCIVVSYCFNLHFLDEIWYGALFSMVICHMYILFGEVSVKVFGPFFLFCFVLFIYLFLAVLSLHFCARAFSSCDKWGPLFIAVCGPLTIAASLVAEHRLQMRRLSNCGSQAQLLRGMWDPPRPGLEPASPALAGRLSTTALPGKPSGPFFKWGFIFLTVEF